MRSLLILLAVLLVAPISGAQASDSTASPPRLVEAQNSPTYRRVRTLVASTLGALGGSGVGGLAGIAVTRPKIFDDMTPVVVSSMVGGSLGAAFGASMDRDRGQSFWRSFGGSALGQAAGVGVGFLVYEATGSDLGYLAVPVGAVGGATWGGDL